MKNKQIQTMTISALLMSIAIIIPMISPIKILIEPASFTLGSHIAIMIAMMISVPVAIFVELGATIGFFLAGFPIVVVLRAFVQVLFAGIGAYILKKDPELMNHPVKIILFIIFTGIIHAVAEVAVSLALYTGTQSTLVYHIFVLVGIGTFVHHCVDYILTIMIYKPLLKTKMIKNNANIKQLLNK